MFVRTDTTTRLGVFREGEENVCQIQCYDGDSNPIKNIEVKGQSEPMQGWYSKNGRELIENTAIGFPVFGKSKIWVTVFDFKMQKTGKPYLRLGTGGKYLRFALTQDDEKMDVKFKIDNEGNRTVEVEIDNSPVDVAIEYNEG